MPVHRRAFSLSVLCLDVLGCRWQKGTGLEDGDEPKKEDGKTEKEIERERKK